MVLRCAGMIRSEELPALTYLVGSQAFPTKSSPGDKPQVP